MAILSASEKTVPGDVILWEEDAHYSRKKVTWASGAGVVAIGAVGGKITATGKFIPVNPASVLGEEGAEVAAAVAIEEVDATTADAEGLALVREAVVNRAKLVWPADVDLAAERQTAVDQLEAVGIIAREGA